MTVIMLHVMLDIMSNGINILLVEVASAQVTVDLHRMRSWISDNENESTLCSINTM